MARRTGKSTRTAQPGRSSPGAAMIGLGVGFLLLVAVSVVTVVLPELRDDAESDREVEGAAAPEAPSVEGASDAPARVSAP